MHPVDGAERLAGVARRPRRSQCHFTQSLRSEPRQLDSRRHGHERLVRADVRRGTLAADVLLAGAKRHDVGVPALPVHGLSDETAGQSPHVGETAGEQAQIRAAEPERGPEGLALPHHDIRAEIAGGPEQPRRDGIEAHDEAGAEALGDGTGSADVLEAAEKVRCGDDDGADAAVVDDGVPGREPSRERHRVDLVPRAA